LPEDFIIRLNSFLPRDIVVQKVFLALEENAHSRWSALERTYHYQACIGRNPLLMGYAAMLYKEVDLAIMNDAASLLTKYTDYTALSKVSPNEEHHLSNIFKAEWMQKGDILIFTITANRFLRGMVRILTGTMLEAGYGKITVKEFENIITGKDRKAAYAAAPAEGLYLWDVKYPEGMLKELEFRGNLAIDN
jgi:tRNA pseudouridine38-40 synthase